MLELSVLTALVTEGARDILCCLVLRNVAKHLSPECRPPGNAGLSSSMLGQRAPLKNIIVSKRATMDSQSTCSALSDFKVTKVGKVF